VFPSPKDAVTFETTQNLPFLNAVINEGMRVMPIVLAGLPRKTTKPTKVNGYDIPSGTTLFSQSLILTGWPSTFPLPKNSFLRVGWRKNNSQRLLKHRSQQTGQLSFLSRPAVEAVLDNSEPFLHPL